MVYSIALATFKKTSIKEEDSNANLSLGDHDEATCITYSGYEPRGTIVPLAVSKLTPRVIEFEERQED